MVCVCKNRMSGQTFGPGLKKPVVETVHDRFFAGWGYHERESIPLSVPLIMRRPTF